MYFSTKNGTILSIKQQEIKGEYSLKNIKMYSQPGCSKCMLLKRLLTNRNFEFEVITDSEVVLALAGEIGCRELPILEIENTYYTGNEALEKIQGA